MKLEKRSDGSDVTPELPEEKGRHPVVVYIVVLFLAAFLLMVLSLVMQHRSNQAMGRLEDSVSALQDRYGERVMSRLTDRSAAQPILLTGENLRWSDGLC